MKVAKVLTAVLLVIALVSCAYVNQLKQNWDNLKTDEKARIVCEFLQSELKSAFDTGKTYVKNNPEFQDTWKTKAVPAFDVANKALAVYMVQAKEDKVTFIDIIKKMQPLLQPILTVLGFMGVDVSNISKFTSVTGG